MILNRFKFKVGEKVKVIAGRDKGKIGLVTQVIKNENRVVVSGVAVRKRHTKPSQLHPKGGVIVKEMPIHISNVMHVDPKTGGATKVSYAFDKDGRKEKIARKSKEIISVE